MRKFILRVSYFLIFIVSTGSLAYGWLLWQMDKAQEAWTNGDAPGAVEMYARLESFFHKVPWLPRLLEEEYKNVSFGQISILYSQGQDDEALKRLEQLPTYAPSLAESGEYSFWMGNLLFRQAARTEDPETSVGALKAALSEYQRGLAAHSDDWDLKYNYELVRTIFSQRDRDKKKEEQKVKSILDKMRPTDPSRQDVPPEKRG
jgi:tetratricopeptide (TPR) repeat protein